MVRDLSLVVAAVARLVRPRRGRVARPPGPTLEAVDYLDTFQGGNFPEGRQSVHFGLTFRHPERTLTGEEVERAVKAVVDACRDRFKANPRLAVGLTSEMTYPDHTPGRGL